MFFLFNNILQVGLFISKPKKSDNFMIFSIFKPLLKKIHTFIDRICTWLIFDENEKTY